LARKLYRPNLARSGVHQAFRDRRRSVQRWLLRRRTWVDSCLIDADNDVALTSCSDGSWCENGAGEACCNAGNGYFIVDGEETTQRPSSSGTSPAMPATANTPSSITNQPTAAATSYASSPSSSSSSSSSSSKSSGGLSAGAVSGISIGGIILAGLGVWITWRQLRMMQKDRKVKKREEESRYAFGGYRA
jgi:hypothetical protein